MPPASTDLPQLLPSELNIVGEPLPLKELTEVLIKHYGFHEGIYDALIEFRIGVGGFGPTPADRTPGAMVGIGRVGLVKAEQHGPNTVDAAVANPAPKKVTQKKVAIKKTPAKK